MKKFQKLIVAVLLSCMLLVPMTATASAADFFTEDNLKGVLQQFGIDLNDPESIRKAIDDITSGGLFNFIGIDLSGFLEELQKYLFAFESETTKPAETTTEEEATTEEPTTEAPTTAPPPVYTPTYPSYEYTPPTYIPATTLPPETTTFQYIPPEQIYTEAFTTTVFKPIVEDNVGSIEDDTNPVKTAIGVILLLGSGIGVIVVVLALKRNRI
ncbi:MAG: hypothetical protein IKL10_02160 [Clostridia bacterium]|nr:hypothetical protein [Clostridia bacterium]